MPMQYDEMVIAALANFELPKFGVQETLSHDSPAERDLASAFHWSVYPNEAAFLARFAEPVYQRSEGTIQLVADENPRKIKGSGLYLKLVTENGTLPFTVGPYMPPFQVVE